MWQRIPTALLASILWVFGLTSPLWQRPLSMCAVLLTTLRAVLRIIFEVIWCMEFSSGQVSTPDPYLHTFMLHLRRLAEVLVLPDGFA